MPREEAPAAEASAGEPASESMSEPAAPENA